VSNAREITVVVNRVNWYMTMSIHAELIDAIMKQSLAESWPIPSHILLAQKKSFFVGNPFSPKKLS